MNRMIGLLLIICLVGCEGPMGPQGEQGETGTTGPQGIQGVPGSAASMSVAYIEFTLMRSSYDNGVIMLQSPRVQIENFLGLSFLAEINGETVVMPLTYPVAAIAPEVSIANRLQIIVSDGLVIILDNDRGLLDFMDGFLGSSGATSMTLAVAIIST